MVPDVRTIEQRYCGSDMRAGPASATSSTLAIKEKEVKEKQAKVKERRGPKDTQLCGAGDHGPVGSWERHRPYVPRRVSGVL